jgi:predicted nucleic acid-binding protein
MMLVVDTSVAVKWVVPENPTNIEADTSAALNLLSRQMIAPDCMLAEFANAMFKKIRRQEISKEQARESLSVLSDLVTFLPTPLFVGPAFELSTQLSHPVHDCLFLVVAIQHDAQLVTADQKFVDRCLETGLNYPVHTLADGSWI